MADCMKFMHECKTRRQKRRRFYYSDDLEEEIEEHFMEEIDEYMLENAAILVGALNSREHNKNRETGKIWWYELYNTRSDEEVKEKIRNRKTFNTILDVLRDELTLQPTHLNPRNIAVLSLNNQTK